MKTRITLFGLTILFAMSGCERPFDVFIPNTLYEAKNLLAINTYAKPEGDTKTLYIEAMSNDSFLYFSKAKISEEEISGKDVILISIYGSRTPNSEFIRSATGNFVIKTKLSHGIGERKIYYRDQSGLHPLFLSAWNIDLDRPYVVPAAIDPFMDLKEMKTTEPNQTVEPTIMAVTDCAPSSTLRAIHDRGSL